MNYQLIKDAIDLVQKYENQNPQLVEKQTNIEGFKNWIINTYQKSENQEEPYWEGKENGRSPESVISTFLTHIGRYAKFYSKSVIIQSEFSSQEDFIYLVTLKTYGSISKMELIKKNVHDKPSGIQIINRLINHGWVIQKDSDNDKRSKVISISQKGIEVLEKQMNKIRNASKVVAGDLNYLEKMELIRLLTRLDNFHNSIYCQNLSSETLLEEALNRICKN